MNKTRIGIIGIGMVGSALKTYFEKKENYEVTVYDKKYDVEEIMERGIVSSVKELSTKADYIYVCVPTPHIEGKGCDTSIVEEVIDQIIGRRVIIIKSTILPGTTERLQKKYPRHKILFSPEFLTELTADQDMSFPDRQIVGYTKQSYNVAKDILQQLPLAPYERIVPATVAEMIKYFNNCWFATKVIFGNQFYDLCKRMEIDYETVVSGAAADKRVGRTHLKVGHGGYRGYGDSSVSKCIPKDTKAIIELGLRVGVPMIQLMTTDRINNELWDKQLKQWFKENKTRPQRDDEADDTRYSQDSEIKR